MHQSDVVLFEQEKFNALSAQIIQYNQEIDSTDCYFELLRISELRDILLAELNQCECKDKHGNTTTIGALARA